MKSKIVISIILIVVIAIIGAIIVSQNNKENNESNSNTTTNNVINNTSNTTVLNEENREEQMEIDSIKVKINNEEYNAILENSETVKEFIALLPKEFNMSELNGNEKYTYLNTTLPTEFYNPKHINAGDIMLYGDDCLVVFYKSFDTSYSYTKIGHIDNLPDLGEKDINIRFEK